MNLFSTGEIIAATRGRLTGGSAAGGVHAVVVDSRHAVPGCLFVALAGERTDGHEYLGMAVDAGASCLLVSEAQASRRGAELAALAARAAVIAVSDPLAGLQDLARLHMGRMPALTRVGITGSNGKTTTKEIVGAILSRGAATAVNEGNLNSEIGLPLACFAVTPAHRRAVFEMGMNHPGEMDVLADIVRPDFAVITNVGTAHVGLLGSREAIAREKKKIFSRFDGRQAGFLHESEAFARLLAEGVRGRIVRFGPASTAGYEGSETLGLDGTLIHWEGSRIRFPLFGPHNLANALAAISVAREMGAAAADIRDGLESVAPLFGRSQILRGQVTVLVDCYNANPDSMESALAFVQALPWKGRKVAVLGAMRELGSQSGGAHRDLAERAARAGLDLLYLFGEEFEEAFRGLAGVREGRVAFFDDVDRLADAAAAAVREGDLVLVKGSRGVALERIVPRLHGAQGASGAHGAEGAQGTVAKERQPACS